MISKKKLPCKEGDWFAVPLKDGGYVLGLAARVSRGHAILGYFFGPRRQNVPSGTDTIGLTASQAFFVGVFSDLGLMGEEWPVVYKPEEWRRDGWPMPDFGRVDRLDARIAYRTTYNENRLTEAVREIRVSPEEAQSLPEDSLFGYVALELHLNRLLS